MDSFQILRELLERDRSVRRFDVSRRVDSETLVKLVELTRYCASGRNIQALRYRIVTSAAECAAIFPALAWAGYYKDWAGPAENERPAAYMVQCLDSELTQNCLCDDGIQLQAITLGATALGLSACIIKSFNKVSIMEAFNLPERYNPLYVIALGYAAEKVRIVAMDAEGDFKYYRGSDDAQCVPKRTVEELIIK